MKKLFTFIIVVAVLAYGGYFGLQQYAPELLEKYVPQEVLDKLPDVTDLAPSDKMSDKEPAPAENPAADFCLMQGGEVQGFEKDDGTFQQICFVNDGLDGVRCDLDLFYKQECGQSVIKSAGEIFIQTRGIPEMYMIIFSDSEIDETGKPVALVDKNRTESWTYGDPVNAMSHFENGFFVEENGSEDVLSLMGHEISPLSFTDITTAEDVTGLMGEADCEVSGEAGPHMIRTLKYNQTDIRPYASFSFSGEQIIAVTVGVAFKEDPESDALCK